MIDIKLEPYCQNCEELELEHDAIKLYSYDRQYPICNHDITCKYISRCKNIAQYIKSQILEERSGKEDD